MNNVLDERKLFQGRICVFQKINTVRMNGQCIEPLNITMSNKKGFQLLFKYLNLLNIQLTFAFIGMLYLLISNFMNIVIA